MEKKKVLQPFRHPSFFNWYGLTKILSHVGWKWARRKICYCTVHHLIRIIIKYGCYNNMHILHFKCRINSNHSKSTEVNTYMYQSRYHSNREKYSFSCKRIQMYSQIPTKARELIAEKLFRCNNIVGKVRKYQQNMPFISSTDM